MQTMIQAIETRYKGCRFRSRLEARWAVFYDALGIPWEYEKEGYQLPSGRYLPDFWLPQQDSWIEIKGRTATALEMQLARELTEATGKAVALFQGSIILPNDDEYPFAPAAEVYEPEAWDHPYLWCQCPKCKAFGLEFDGRSDRLPCHKREKAPCPSSPHGDKGYNYDSADLIRAYEAALSARFEHGESGAG